MEMRDSIFYVGISFFIVLYGSMIVSFVIKKIQDYRNPGIEKTKEFRKWERNRKLKSKFAGAMFFITILAPAILVYIFLKQLGASEAVSTLGMLAAIIVVAFFQIQLIGYRNHKDSFFDDIEL